eukprot:jgi/Ulvmu1/12858/UM098_0043.1
MHFIPLNHSQSISVQSFVRRSLAPRASFPFLQLCSNMELSDFRLRRILKGHSEDVRALAVVRDQHTIIFTASRDKTIKVWEDDGMSIEEKSTLIAHSGFVVSVAAVTPGTSPIVPGVAVVSGSQDTTVNVWDVQECASVQQLKGHELQVNAVGILPGGEIVSGGMDGLLKMWKGGKAVFSQKEHSAPILCICVLASGEFLTGSGDKSIKKWSGNVVDRTYTGHTDSVRGLCEVPGMGFVSASHDSTLRLWGPSGECMTVFVGHTSLVYACAASSSCIASGSEDQTMKIWSMAGECRQTISFAGCIWSVAFLPSGDAVAGASDSKAYVFSSDEIRQAPADMHVAFEAEVAAYAAENASTKGSAGIPEDQIKPPSALLAPGPENNANMIVRENDGKLMAYVWSADDMKWSVLGEVMERPEDTMNVPKKWHDGKEWDYVFDVDVSEGAPPLKLPMDKGEDPYDVAERFLMRHGLPESYLEQVAAFIVENTAGESSAQPMTVADPLTGAGAYVPSADSSGHVSQSANPDPFTGGGAYVPDEPGGGTATPTAPMPPGLTFTPHKHYQGFEAVPDGDKVAAKIRELAADVKGANALSPDEVAPGGPVDEIVTIATAGSGSLAQVIETLGKLAKWPGEQLFPVLDIFRLLVLSAGTARLLAADAGPLDPSNDGLGGMIARGVSAEAVASRMVAVRLGCNCFLNAALRDWILSHSQKLLYGLAGVSGTNSKPFRVAYSTALLNLSVAIHVRDCREPDGLRVQILSQLHQLMTTTPNTEHDALFREVLTVATVAVGDREAIQMGVSLGLPEVLKGLLGNNEQNDKLKAAIADALAVLRC